MRLLWKTTLSRGRYKNLESFSRHTRGMDMGLVRRINESGKGCGAILNKSAVKNLLYCGMKSSLSFQGQDKYHLCEDCFLLFKMSQEIQTK
jgi:hypothetical protein